MVKETRLGLNGCGDAKNHSLKRSPRGTTCRPLCGTPDLVAQWWLCVIRPPSHRTRGNNMSKIKNLAREKRKDLRASKAPYPTPGRAEGKQPGRLESKIGSCSLRTVRMVLESCDNMLASVQGNRATQGRTNKSNLDDSRHASETANREKRNKLSQPHTDAINPDSIPLEPTGVNVISEYTAEAPDFRLMAQQAEASHTD
ncbi:hypothetical protein EAI_01288 [Harpegnathos saltator]|uniref:Uncharacterized protein n=1 Tax=Harpegnathos saltator TaxID=610380 RepID=E2B8L0_HARSA|nr:hypothetical protein EAI_01288 [Harpegnathos saltator]